MPNLKACYGYATKIGIVGRIRQTLLELYLFAFCCEGVSIGTRASFGGPLQSMSNPSRVKDQQYQWF